MPSWISSKPPFSDASCCSRFLTDLIELAHLFMKMYENFSMEQQVIFVQKKRKTKAKASSKAAGEGEEPELEAEPEEEPENHEPGTEGDGDAKNKLEKKKRAERGQGLATREERLDFKIFQLVGALFSRL